MTYAAYLKFFNLKDTAENHESWLYSEWRKGRLYKYNGEFFSTTTGEKVKPYCHKKGE